MSYDVAKIQEMIDAYVAAELAVLSGKSWAWKGRMFTSEDLPEIKRGRAEWERMLITSQSSGGVKKFVQITCSD